MTRLILLILFVLNCINVTIAQQFMNLPPELRKTYELSNEAELLIFKKKHKDALIKLKSIDVLNINKYRNHLLKLKCYHGLNDTENIIRTTQTIIEKYGVRMSFINNDLRNDTVDFNSIQSLINEDSCYLTFVSKHINDRDLFNIEHVFFNDLFFRNQINSINDNLKQNYMLAKQYDSAFARPVLIDLIEKYHFPDENDVGQYTMSLFYFLLRHNNIEKQILDSALKSGKVSPFEYASLTDYLFNWSYNETSSNLEPLDNYGTILKKTVSNTFVIIKIDNIKQVDKRRAAIGLPPLWQTALIENYILPNEYVEWLNEGKIPYDK